MIDPQFWDDQKLANVPWQARFVFIGLISHADDEGRLCGHIAILLSRLFHATDAVTADDLETWLAALEKERLIVRYEANREKYIWLPGFSKHQSLRHRSPSKIPSPPEEVSEESRTTTAQLPHNYRTSTAHIILREEKRREGEEKRSVESSSVEKSPERERTISAFVRLYTASPPGVDPPYHLYPSEAILDDIGLLAELWGDDIVQEAISVAVGAGKVGIGRAYLEAIILNWKEEGKVKTRLTKKEYEALESKRPLD